MAVCPNCKYEYIEGMTICPDCGASLVNESEIQKQEGLSEDDWEIIYTSDKEYEVEMIKDNLETAGISANIISLKDRNFPAPGDLSVIKLLVKKCDVKDALEYIEEMRKINNSDNEQPE